MTNDDKLEAARQAVKDHITKHGRICNMSEQAFADLKDLNKEVEVCMNNVFDFHTVEIKS